MSARKARDPWTDENGWKWREWHTEGGLLRRIWTDPLGKKGEIWEDEDGSRWIKGEGGGMIVFMAEEGAKVYWMETAALTQVRGIVEHDKARTAGKLNDLFEEVAMVRRCAVQGFEFSKSTEDERALKELAVFLPLARLMLHAVAKGEVDTIRAVAKHLENIEGIRKGEIEINTRKWSAIADAIGESATEVNGIPVRRAVEKRLQEPSGLKLQGDDVREALERMGFGWLPAPNGRPKKVE